MFRMVEKRRKIERGGAVVAVSATCLPVVNLTQNRRIAAEHRRVTRRFDRWCDTKLAAAALDAFKLCENRGERFAPLSARLDGRVTLSDEQVYCVVFETTVSLPGGRVLRSVVSDPRSAADGYPLTVERLADVLPLSTAAGKPRKRAKLWTRALRKELRRQLTVRARFDESIKPRRLSRKIAAHRIAPGVDGAEYLIPGMEPLRIAAGES